jgi:hypothetical protein
MTAGQIAMSRYWFKPHEYGYGATPVTWEGWVLVGAYVAVLTLMTVLFIGSGRYDMSALGPYAALVLIASVALILIARWKTDGEWRWRWGKKHG